MSAFSASALLVPATSFLAGALLGWLHFATLRAVTRGYLEGSVPRAALFQLARIGLLVAALVLLARIGAGALLGGALGLLAARFVVLRKAKREP